jgi:hypothetical protein
VVLEVLVERDHVAGVDERGHEARRQVHDVVVPGAGGELEHHLVEQRVEGELLDVDANAGLGSNSSGTAGRRRRCRARGRRW